MFEDPERNILERPAFEAIGLVEPGELDLGRLESGSGLCYEKDEGVPLETEDAEGALDFRADGRRRRDDDDEDDFDEDEFDDDDDDAEEDFDEDFDEDEFDDDDLDDDFEEDEDV